jgi:HD-GYP domain-containing protein (c-di-GMP phosphodiesterase class II)
VLESPDHDALHVVVAYLGFLHDRLVTRTPDITAVSLRRSGPEGKSSTVLTTSRSHLDNGWHELRASVEPERVAPEGYRELVFDFLHRGVVEGAVVLEAPADLVLGPDIERRLRLYALVAVSGIRYDLGDSWLDSLRADLPVSRHRRDTRGSSHLERVAGYAHVIVRTLTDPLRLTPEFADAVFRYAPLHDVGQIVLRESILYKPGRLDADEWRVMKTHTSRGLAIIDDLIAEAGTDDWPRIDVLRHIVELHHEALDGSGYPRGIAGDEVPLEARVVTVADVFDALTSRRPYKPDWSVDEALSEMDRMVLSGKIDGRCLTALVTQPEVRESVAISGAEPPEDPR